MLPFFKARTRENVHQDDQEETRILKPLDGVLSVDTHGVIGP